MLVIGFCIETRIYTVANTAALIPIQGDLEPGESDEYMLGLLSSGTYVGVALL